MRFYLSTVVIRSVGDDYAFLGTLTVNLLGCFIIGLLAVIIARTTHLSPHAQRLLITGLIGSLTTFSTFALDTLNLLQQARVGAAILNTGTNVLAGILLVWLGMLVAGAILPDIPQQTTDSPSPASGSSH
jgi:CrcB protein